MNGRSRSVVGHPQNLSRDTHFCVQRTYKQLAFLWQSIVFTDKSMYVAQNIYWMGVGKKSSYVENSYECITVFENHKMFSVLNLGTIGMAEWYSVVTFVR